MMETRLDAEARAKLRRALKSHDGWTDYRRRTGCDLSTMQKAELIAAAEALGIDLATITGTEPMNYAPKPKTVTQEPPNLKQGERYKKIECGIIQTISAELRKIEVKERGDCWCRVFCAGVGHVAFTFLQCRFHVVELYAAALDGINVYGFDKPGKASRQPDDTCHLFKKDAVD
jgi:hypothetical protein